MAFKVPTVPKIKKSHRIQRNYDGLPVTLPEDLQVVKIVGRGSFGIVKLCIKKMEKEVILKEMLDCSEDQAKQFIKEAKIINTFKHQNIVQFDSVYQSNVPDTLAFLMEYVYFNFEQFGEDVKLSSLKELLLYLDQFHCTGFEHFQIIIAKDITRGLSFLHENNVVHRDLKPDNVLVSNQHYCTSAEIGELWMLKPVIAKITDFGESRASLIQTATLISTKTSNISRGTPVYMAPEAFTDRSVQFGLNELKNMDIWALLMTFYILINPDKKYPFVDEVKSLENAGVANIMKHIFKNQSAPKHSDKYKELRIGQWGTIQDIFETGTSSRRPSIKKILLTLEQEPNTDKSEFDDMEEIDERDPFKENSPVKKSGWYGSVFYNNPPSWTDWHKPGALPFLKMKCVDKNEAGIPDEKVLKRTLPVHTIDDDGKEKLNNPKDDIQIMWIGHATLLVQFDGLTVLTDPVFLNRCSPVPFAGPYRYRPVPCEIEDLPKIDTVIVSHNHYDHLESDAVAKLNSRFKEILWYVPEGTGSWFKDCDCQNVKEMTWWDEDVVSIGNKYVKFCCVPAQHWSQRTPTDAMKSLWCGWVIKSKHAFYYSGDTGYCPVFKVIGEKYGPMDLSAIPIGCYAPRYFMKPQYISPKEAVLVHAEVGSKCSVGIHWGTFGGLGSHEFYMEPKTFLETEVSRAKEENANFGDFFTVEHGKILTIK